MNFTANSANELGIESYLAHVNAKEEKQSLQQHLLQVAHLSSKNASKLGLESSGKLLGLLHDLGKYSEAFQKYLSSATGLTDQDADDYVDTAGLKGKIDHSTAGAQFIWNSLKNENQQKRIVGQVLALCLASHHSGMIDSISLDGKDDFTRRMNKAYELSHFPEVIEKADDIIVKQVKELITNSEEEIINFFKGLVGSKKNETIIRFYSSLLGRMLFSCLIDADRMDTADFENPKQAKTRQHGNYSEWELLTERLDKHLKSFATKSERNKIDDLRDVISEACYQRASDPTGIFSLTVPTGGGKTLASLRFALHHAKKHSLDRIIYVIPFTSIIDQNAQVVRGILEVKPSEKGRIVMEHHSNLMPEVQNWKNKILTENWDSPIIFTTSIQLLETLFGGGTRSVRRMHQLANSLIIFDEVQTLPVKTVHLFCNAMNFLTSHCHSSLVLCTATQPLLNKVSEDKGRLVFDKANEIISDVEKLFADLKRVKIENSIKPQGWTSDEVSELAQKLVTDTGSCLVIVNTKKNARLIYDSCSLSKNVPVYHLSTSMCPAHRMQKLDEIRKKLEENKSVLCISTQLIEAGVDVDFGSVIRFVAGLDSIAQAAGRCNRNDRRESGLVFILNPAEETIESLTDIKLGKEQTERILREQKLSGSELPDDLLHPQIMERYFQYYFYNRASDMVFPVDVGRDDNLLNLLSSNPVSVEEYKRINDKMPEIYFRQSFMKAGEKFKAIEAPTQGIVVPWENEGKEIIADLFSDYAFEKRFSLLRRAQRFTVNVFPNVLKKLIEARAVKEVPEIGVLTLSDDRYYHQEFGLSSGIVQDYNTLIK